MEEDDEEEKTEDEVTQKLPFVHAIADHEAAFGPNGKQLKKIVSNFTSDKSP